MCGFSGAGGYSTKSESESIGSPVSFFSRDSNLSEMSSSPDNFLNSADSISCHSKSLGIGGSAGGGEDSRLPANSAGSSMADAPGQKSEVGGEIQVGIDTHFRNRARFNINSRLRRFAPAPLAPAEHYRYYV